jgi:alanyl-tRNA synthetase
VRGFLFVGLALSTAVFSEAGNITAHIKAIFHNKLFVQSTSDIHGDSSFGVILDRTSFYAEAGGQEYDTGNIVIDGIADFEVTNVQVFNGYVLHIGHLKYGTLQVGNEVISSYDEVCSRLLLCEPRFTFGPQLRRWPIRNNHTATHILNFCLREILGDHVDQRGSLVTPTKLRFDLSHKAQISLPELLRIESMSLDWIKKNVKVYSQEMNLKTAKQIPGLRAVFGETYPDPVRVVTLEHDIGTIAKDIENPKWRATSVEFCGGTYVSTFCWLIMNLTFAAALDTCPGLGISRTLLLPKSRGLQKGSDGSLL